MNCEKLLSKKIGYSILAFVGFLFVFLWKAESDLAKWGNVIWDGSYVAKIVGISLGLGIALGCVIAYIMYAVAEKKFFPAGKIKIFERLQEAVDKLSFGKVFGGSLLLIMITRIPFYLAYYPAICAYDSIYQTGQIVSGEYIDHHPIAHTLLIKGGMQLGDKLFGSVNTGIGVHAFVQMFFLSAAFAFGIALLHRFHVKVGGLLLMLVYVICFPFHIYMSVSMTKDTWFTACFLLQILVLLVLLQKKENSIRPGVWDMAFFLSTIGMILFRNNGKYALLVLLVCLLPVLIKEKGARKFWTRIFLNGVTALLVGNLILSALFNVTHAGQGDKREMLSIPIQQLARCMLYHGGADVLAGDDNTMEEKDKALIRDFLLEEAYKKYNPHIADPVKGMTNTYVVRYRAGEFITTYARLLCKYPSPFINAFLEVNAGYLYPNDVSHATINENGVESGLGFVQTRWVEPVLNEYGIYKDSKWPALHEKMERWADENAYLKIPVLKYLFVPGVWFWYSLLLSAYLMLRKRFRINIAMLLVFAYYITLFLGPTVQMRYVYPIMVVVPYLVLIGSKSTCLEEKHVKNE